MANETNDQSAKDEIAKGMAESGKDAAPTPGKKGGTGPAGSDEVTQGMSESGSGAPTGGEGKSTSAGKR